MTDEEFNTARDSVLTNVAEKDKNQREDFSRIYNSEICSHRYQFDRQEREIEMIKTLTRAEFQAYFDRVIFTERKRLDMRWNS